MWRAREAGTPRRKGVAKYSRAGKTEAPVPFPGSFRFPAETTPLVQPLSCAVLVSPARVKPVGAALVAPTGAEERMVKPQSCDLGVRFVLMSCSRKSSHRSKI